MINEGAFNKQLKNEDVLRWFAFGIIALAVLIVYFPTLYYPPRADQVVYLAEISKKQTPTDLIFAYYNYPRTRVFGQGDELLFRPFIFMFLGAEQVVFGHQF